MKLKILESEYKGYLIEVKVTHHGHFHYVINGIETLEDFNDSEYALMEAKRFLMEQYAIFNKQKGSVYEDK